MVLSSVGSWIVQIRREEETMRYKHFPPFFFALFHPYAARWVGLFFGTISVYVAGFEKVKKKTNALPHGSPAPVAAPFSIFFTMAALTQRSLQYYLGQMHGIGGCPTAPMQLTLMTRFPPKKLPPLPLFLLHLSFFLMLRLETPAWWPLRRTFLIAWPICQSVSASLSIPMPICMLAPVPK